MYLPFGQTQPPEEFEYEPFLTLPGTGANVVTQPDSSTLDIPSSHTISTWFKTSKDYTSDGMIVNKGGIGSDSSGENMNYGIRFISSDKINAGFETSTGADNFVTTPNTYNDGQWHYATYVFDDAANTIKLYIDGVLKASATGVTGVPETNEKPLKIGANSRGDNRYFTGDVDEVRIWKGQALSASQVSDAFNGDFGSLPAPIVYLNFGTSTLTATQQPDSKFDSPSTLNLTPKIRTP